MEEKISETKNTAFYQLTTLYAFCIVGISLGFLSKYTVQFHFFALVIAIVGVFVVKKEKSFSFPKNVFLLLFATTIAIIALCRYFPYRNSRIPLGYDAGIYRYAIEHGLANKDQWILRTVEPGFLYLMKPFTWLFSVDTVLTWMLIGWCLVLGLAIYFVAKEYANKEVGLIALLFYAVSLIQYRTFAYAYYKNIVGLVFMLLAIYALKKSESNKKYAYLFVLAAGLLGAIHRPTFYMFGVSYFFYAFIEPYRNKSYDVKKCIYNCLLGAAILIITALFYIGDFRTAIVSLVEPVLESFAQPGESPGTFITFFNFQFSILPYLPLALIGFFLNIRRKKQLFLSIWTILNVIIVYFQFFFYNRFIIFLDLNLIILAAFGLQYILENKAKWGICLMILLLGSASILAVHDASIVHPLISEEELKEIKQLAVTPEDSFVMATSSLYAPWLQGYSQRKTIAPGVFDYDNYTPEEWTDFWSANNTLEACSFLYDSPEPLYVYIGPRQKDKLASLPCVEVWHSGSSSKIYHVISTK